MADAEEKEEQTEGTEEKAPKKQGNMLMIIIIAVLVLVIIGGVVVALLLMGDDEPQAQAQQVRAPQTQEKSHSRSQRNSNVMVSRKLNEIGILYPLDTFTVNLKSDAGRRYLKATLSLELNGEELSMELDNKAPVIRDRIIRILTSKTLEEVSSKKGKQKVSEQIMDTLNSMIVDGRIEGIYFTDFVIQ